jgi:hypothetical protein
VAARGTTNERRDCRSEFVVPHLCGSSYLASPGTAVDYELPLKAGLRTFIEVMLTRQIWWACL